MVRPKSDLEFTRVMISKTQNVLRSVTQCWNFRRALGAGTQVGLVIAFASVTVRGQEEVSGTIRIDGSSTVAPITMAASEMFMEAHPKVRITVGISGTGGGFKKFLDQTPDLRTHISDASRPITATELERAKKLGVEFIEVPIGLDGLSVMVHPSNTFCDYLTVEELRKIWELGSNITNWSHVRAGFPDLPLKLYGPDTDSGTFDYFTEAIVGKARSSRSDYTASVSDNVLVRGIAGDRGALGYFGFAYYEANQDQLKLVAIASGNGKPVKPTKQTINNGTYRPLSRPMFFYVNKEAYETLPQVRAFLDFVFENARKIVEHPRVRYVALSDSLYQVAEKRLHDRKTGSAMAKAEGASSDLMEVFRKY